MTRRRDSPASHPAALGAQAQTALPIKPGLWQIHSEREVNRPKVPDLSERMKNMSPEARKQVEAMMKQQGVDGCRWRRQGLLQPRDDRAGSLGRRIAAI